MTEVKVAAALGPPDSGNKPAGMRFGGPSAALLVLHAPRAHLGKLLEVHAHFALGGADSDFVVEGAAASGSRLEIVSLGEKGAHGEAEWRAHAQGSVTINRKAVTQHTLVAGDELRVVGMFFRFLCGTDVQRQYHEGIYQLTIRDFPTGLHNRRYLQEALERELFRAARNESRLAVAVLDWEPNPEMASHDLLGAFARRIREGAPREFWAARNAEHEIVVVAPGTSAAELERTVREWLRGCPEPNRLGIAEADGASRDSLAVIAAARGKAR